READLEVPAVLLGGIDRELVSGAGESVRRLEDAADDVEREQVLDEALAVDPGPEDALERALGAVLGERVAEPVRERADVLVLRQLGDGGDPERAVEVAVEVGLRKRVEERAAVGGRELVELDRSFGSGHLGLLKKGNIVPINKKLN